VSPNPSQSCEKGSGTVAANSILQPVQHRRGREEIWTRKANFMPNNARKSAVPNTVKEGFFMFSAPATDD